MMKRIAVIALALFVASLGTALAADIEGTVTKAEGSSITVKGKDGKEVKLRLSSSSTTIKKAGKTISRDDVKEGDKVKAVYDEKDDRKTASSVTID